MNRFKFEETVPNQSGAMEADTASKNGASSKIQKIRWMIFSFVLAVFFSFGCDKEEILSTKYDIYLAGVNKDGFATYWKNGVAHVNQNLKGLYIGIAVENGDVYTLFRPENSDVSSNHAYYKNNEAPVVIEGRALGIAVSNGNVYVTGNTGTAINNMTAHYWINGVRTTLSTRANAKSIFVSNDNVYIAGCTWHEYTTYPVISAWYSRAVYWRNGTLVTLGGSYGNIAEAFSIFASGNDIYVGGYHGGTTVYTPYWKNGNLFNLPNTSGGRGNVGQIFVSTDGTVHMAGIQFISAGKYHIKYWRNNEEIFRYEVENTANYNESLYVMSNMISGFAVADNDIYIIGDDFEKTTNLKNGKIDNFTNEDGAKVFRIVVVPR